MEFKSTIKSTEGWCQMNYKLRLLIVDMLDILVKFIVIYSILTTLLYQIDNLAAFYNLGLLPVPFLSYIIKNKTKHIWSFVLLHIAIIPLYIFTIFNSYVVTLFCIYIVATAFFSYYSKHKNVKSATNNFFLLMSFVVMYIGAATYESAYLELFILRMAIIFTILSIIRMYLLNFTNYFKSHGDIKNIPFSQIKNANNTLIIFLIGLILVIMFLFSQLHLQGSLLSLVRNIAKYLRRLIAFIRGKKVISDELPIEELEEVTEYPPLPEPSLLSEIISKIIIVIFYIFSIALILSCIAYLIYKIYQFFYKNNINNSTDRVEFLSPFTKKEAARKATHKSNTKLFGRSNNVLIRKHFYKAVTSSVKNNDNINKELTPTELAQLVKFDNDSIANRNNIDAPIELAHLNEFEKNNVDHSNTAENRRLLTTYYEKARYSNDECSKEDVKLIKNLVKKVN